MKIFIGLPTWLGDSVMASAALHMIFEHFLALDEKLNKKSEFVLYGSFVSTELFKKAKNVRVYVEEKKHRFTNFYKLSKALGCFDYAFSFRSAFSAKLMLFMLKSKHKFCFDKAKNRDLHQVLKYLYFVENALKVQAKNSDLFLPIKAFENLGQEAQNKLFEKFNITKGKKLLGINAGAKYGSAKRWSEEYFAKVAQDFSATHQILIFGVASEGEICAKIAHILAQNGISALNLCAKTSIKELCELISALDIFISNDSGAMHIAAAYATPTIAVFGPTKFTQTSPWHNKNARLVYLNLPCQPCMQRTCPLKHHKCMQDLRPELVIQETRALLANTKIF